MLRSKEVSRHLGGHPDAFHHISGENTYPKKCFIEHFLGFTHICGTDRGGKFALVRVPSIKSRRKFLAKSKAWLRKNRHGTRQDQQKQLTLMLRGFYQYFGLHHCSPKLRDVRLEVVRQWVHILRRRSQRHRLHWSYLQRQPWFELPYAVAVLHPTV
jgi:RNA-directed DNA polymerase